MMRVFEYMLETRAAVTACMQFQTVTTAAAEGDWGSGRPGQVFHSASAAAAVLSYSNARTGGRLQ